MTGKQRAYLRGLANKIPAKYQIGKNGIDYNLLSLLRDALEKTSLLRFMFLKIQWRTQEKSAVSFAKL